MFIIKKTYKFLSYILLLFIILISSIVFLGPYLINSETFRHNISLYLENTIQREVFIKENIKIRFFPWIGFEIHGVTVADKEDYGSEPLLKFKEADVQLELMPLFKKELIFKKILFKRLRLKLLRNIKGETNWNEILALYSGTNINNDNNEDTSNYSLLDFGQISIRDSEIYFEDRTKNTSIKFDNVNFDRKGIVSHIFSLNFNISELNSPFITHGNFSGNAKIRGLSTFKPKEKIFKINQSLLNVKYKYDDNKNTIEGEISASAIYDFISGKIDILLDLCKIPGINLVGNIKGSDLYTRPIISGDIKFQSADINNFFTKFNVKPLLSGKTDGEVSFQTSGKTKNEIIDNLSSRFDLNINLLHLIFNQENIKQYIQDIRINKSFLRLDLKKGRNNKNQRTLYYNLDMDSTARSFKKKIDCLFSSNGQIVLCEKFGDYYILDSEINIETRLPETQYKSIFFNSFMDLDSKKETIDLKKISISGLDINAKANILIKNYLNKPFYQGYINVNAFSPRKLLSLIGQPLRLKPDCQLYKKAKIKTKFEVSENIINLKKLDFEIDETRLKGHIDIQNFKKPVVSFDLKGTEIDVDKYLASYYYMLYDTNTNTTKKKSIDGNGIHSFLYNGNIRFNKYKVYNVKFTNFYMNIKGADGIFNIDPFDGDTYTGRSSGRINIDYRAKPLTTIVKADMKDIRLEGFLKDFFYWGDTVSGKSDVNLWLSGKGGKWNDFITTLNGKADFEIRNGAIHGVTIVPNIIKKQLRLTDPKQNINEIPKIQNFKKMKGLIISRNGVLSTDKIVTTANKIYAQGSGYVDYPGEYIDYYVRVKIANIPLIPYKIRGPFNNIDFSLDRSEFLKETVQGILKGAEGVSSKTIKKTINIGKDAIKDTIDVGGKAFDLNTKPLKKSLDNGSDAIQNTFGKGSDAIKGTFKKGSNRIQKTYESIKSKKNAIGKGIKGLFKRKNNQEEKTQE